jgi:hypothetical protein
MRRVFRIVVDALRPHSSLLMLALVAASATTYVACIGDDTYNPGDGATDTKPTSDSPTNDAVEDKTDDSPVTN